MLTSYLTDEPVTEKEQVQDLVPDFHLLLRSGHLLPLDESKPLLVKTHFLPSVEITRQYRSATSKVVYLVRNPRDVLLSAAPSLGVSEARDEDARTFARNFIAHEGDPRWRETSWGSWPEHIEDWTAPKKVRGYFPNIGVLVVRYEDLRADTAVTLHRVLEFLNLGQPVEKDRVQRAVDNSSIEKMRGAEEKLARYRSFHPSEFQGVGKGLQAQSLAFLSEDIEAAYRKLVADDGEFAQYVKKFGYDG